MKAHDHDSPVIVGAGPYGLSLAARLKKKGVQAHVFGTPLETWKRMPEGLYLCSKITPAFDPFGDGSFAAYLTMRGIELQTDPPPISRTLFLEYAEWFMERHALVCDTRRVTRVSRERVAFVLSLNDGTNISARKLVIATGINDYIDVPEIAHTIPRRLWDHTSSASDLGRHKGEHVLVVGGRQAALEWTALLREAGAAVETVYRHDTPKFSTPDWAILKRIREGTQRDPAWFPNLPQEEQDAIVAYVRPAAKQQVEPWLEERVIDVAGITLHPNTVLVGLSEDAGRVWADVEEGNAQRLGPFDFVIFGTGYRPDLMRMTILSDELRAQIRSNEGYPELSVSFESSVPHLYFPGLIAEKRFSPLMGFMNMCEPTATILATALLRAP